MSEATPSGTPPVVTDPPLRTDVQGSCFDCMDLFDEGPGAGSGRARAWARKHAAEKGHRAVVDVTMTSVYQRADDVR